MPTYRLSYYPWITQHVPPAEVRQHVESFAVALQRALGAAHSVTVLPPLEVNQQIDQLLGGGSEIALMNPLGYVFARNRPKGATVASIAIAQRLIDRALGSTYFAQIYTRNTTALRADDNKLAVKLRGRSIGYGVPYSTSNFLLNALSLKEQLGIHHLTHFGRVEFLGGHDTVAKAVYEGRVDVGAGHDGVIVDLGNQSGYGDANEKLVQLLRSDPIPSDPVVVRIADAQERSAMQAALVTASQSAEGKAALEGFWGKAQGLKAIEANEYAMVDDAMKELKFEERDLLRPS
jgi:phosphonate transport system substrate-binding protein